MIRWNATLAVCAALLAACGGGETGSSVDAGGGSDSGSVVIDGGAVQDASVDAATTASDASSDASSLDDGSLADADADASLSPDATIDMGAALPDAAIDMGAALPDAAVDMGVALADAAVDMGTALPDASMDMSVVLLDAALDMHVVPPDASMDTSVAIPDAAADAAPADSGAFVCSVPVHPADTVCIAGEQEDMLANRAVCAARDLRVPAGVGSAPAATTLGGAVTFSVSGGLCRGNGTVGELVDWFKLYVRAGETWHFDVPGPGSPVDVETYFGAADARTPSDLSPVPGLVRSGGRSVGAEESGWLYIGVSVTSGGAGRASYTLNALMLGVFDCASANVHAPYGSRTYVGGLAEGERGCFIQGDIGSETAYRVVTCREGVLVEEDDCLARFDEPHCAREPHTDEVVCQQQDGDFDCAYYGLEPGESMCQGDRVYRCFTNAANLYETFGAGSVYDPANPLLLYDPEGAELYTEVQVVDCANSAESGFVPARSCGFDALTAQHTCLGSWYPEQGSAAPPLPSAAEFPSPRTVISACVAPLDGESQLSWASLDSVGTIYNPVDVLVSKPRIDALHEQGIPVVGYYGFQTIEQVSPFYSRDYDGNEISDPFYTFDILNLHGIGVVDPDCYEPLSEQVKDMQDGTCSHESDGLLMDLEGGVRNYYVSACRPAFQDALIEFARLSVSAGVDALTYDVATWGLTCFGPELVSGFKTFLGDPSYLDSAMADDIHEELAAASVDVADLSELNIADLLMALGGTAGYAEVGVPQIPLLWAQWERYNALEERRFANRLRTELDVMTGFGMDPNAKRIPIAFNRYTDHRAFVFDDVASYGQAETFVTNGAPSDGTRAKEGVPYPLNSLEFVYSAFDRRGRNFWSWNWPDAWDDRNDVFVAETFAMNGISQVPYCSLGFQCPCGESDDCSFRGYDPLRFDVRAAMQPVYEFVESHQSALGLPKSRADIAIYVSLPSLPTVQNHWAMQVVDRLTRDLGYTVDVIVSGSRDWMVPTVARAGDLEGYSLVIVPMADRIGDDQLAELDSYVTSGGKVFALGQIASFDEYGRTPTSATVRNRWRTTMGNAAWASAGRARFLRVGNAEFGGNVTTLFSEAYLNDASSRESLRTSLSTQLGALDVAPSHGHIADGVHVSHREAEDGSFAVHVVNYNFADRPSSRLVSERAGVCESEDIVYADSVATTMGTFTVPLDGAFAATGGIVTLGRFGAADVSIDVPAGVSNVNITLEGGEVRLTRGDHVGSPCDGETEVCAPLGEGLAKWWIVAGRPR